jgi:hypothetical protein
VNIPYEEDLSAGQDFDDFEFEVTRRMYYEMTGTRDVGGEKLGQDPDGFRRKIINPVVDGQGVTTG